MNTIENDYIKFWKDQGILYSHLKRPMDLGLDEVSEIIELRHKISNNEHQYWCLDHRNLKTVSKEAHDYTGKHGHDFVHACAVISNSFLTTFIINIYIRIQRPEVPMKIFSSKESAVQWLMKMKETR